jgi:catechol 2,3-dioxygenase-like lactoylglutathione lyase family enzyme
MKRFHIHVGVKNLEEAVNFYSTLFGAHPVKLKSDYAKWLLDDPKLNFAISTRSENAGIDHLGIQVDSDEELGELTSRLKNADQKLFDVGETTCCYMEANKAWVQDPAGIAWEAYRNMADASLFGKDRGKAMEPTPDTSLAKKKGSCC